MLTKLAKHFCLFSALSVYNPDDNNSLYNLIDNNKHKRDFDTTFINSHLLVNNHNQKAVNLSFASYEYPNAIKLNQSWQLDSLDSKPIYIIKAILLAVFLF